MSITGSIVTYLIIWWTVLFAVLPWGVKSVWEDPENQPKGVEQGAPLDPQLKKKALHTTWISAIVWLVVFLVISSGIIDSSE